ncbi:MAG: transporter [Acidobacteriota bacterium]
MLPIFLTVLVLAQQPPPAAPPPADGPLISDNSFLVEEAYNQEAGVVQHISVFQRDKRTGNWAYSFTQEWPAPWDAKHQLSYTVTGVNAGAGAGVGDALLNWRYQVVQNERVAFAPRVSLSLPTGDADKGRGAGATALDVNMPVSISNGTHVTWHLNAGTFVGLTRPNQSDRVAVIRAAGSAILLPYRRVNVLLEILSSRERLVPGAWTTTTTVSPGVRWAYNFSNGLQIVPGVALPIDLARGEDVDWGVIGYLSFEHPFGRRP